MTGISLSDWFKSDLSSSMPIYLVGGTVRDMLLNKKPADLDLVCRNAEGLASKIACEQNAALVRMEKRPGEACYRIIDRAEKGKFIDIAEMKGDTIYDDLRQRDFTINAVAIRVRDDCGIGEVIDPLGGIRDIENRIIRITSANAFVSDPLRILRAVRLACLDKFSITPETLQEMELRAGMLNAVSAERIMAELSLILGARHASGCFRHMDSLGILNIIFPETGKMKACTHDESRGVDVLGHAFLVMEGIEEIAFNLRTYFDEKADEVSNSIEKSGSLSLLKLTALLHDAGKPAAKDIDSRTGKTVFRGHYRDGASIAAIIAERLKMSNTMKDYLCRLAAEHIRTMGIVRRDAATGSARWFRSMRDYAIPAIILSMADVMAVSHFKRDHTYLRDYLSRAADLVNEYFSSIKPRLDSRSLVSGVDLIGLGMEPGPGMGRLILRLRRAQDAGELSDRKEAIKMAKELLSKR